MMVVPTVLLCGVECVGDVGPNPNTMSCSAHTRRCTHPLLLNPTPPTHLRFKTPPTPSTPHTHLTPPSLS